MGFLGAGGGGNGESVFKWYRISVLQDEKHYGDGSWLHNIRNVFDTTELHT